MPATNYTPIQLYRSTTSGAVPSAGNLSAGELALNIADNDMTLYMENASGTVKRVFNNPAGLKYPTVDGTSGQVIKTDGAGNLSFQASSGGGGALTTNVRQAVTSSSTTTLNLNSGNVIDLTMAANITTLSFTNVPASGTPILVMIVVKNASNGTAYTITWPSSVYWSGQYSLISIGSVQTAPTLATGANGVTVIALLTTDGGTKWRGWIDATIPGGSLNSLYSWGSNSSGQLGQNSTAYLSSPVQVGALTNWSSVSTGSSFCAAIKTDGTLWTWGSNGSGALAPGVASGPRSSPVQVGALTNWASVSTGVEFCIAVKTDGTLWSWGAAVSGQLGQNSITDRNSPVQVGALTNWASVSAGASFSTAVKTDNTLWTWGLNNVGQLGLGNKINTSSPVQVGGLTNWRSSTAGASFCVAVKTNNTLWSWGRGQSGQLAQNNSFLDLSSPVQVGALTDWSSASAGFNDDFCAAVKTDGTLWSWGAGTNGKLGQNSTANLSSPVQVGALTNWSSAAAGNEFCIVVKTDGTLWSWGQNSSGELGQNSTANRSSPVQVGALTNWTKPGAGDNSSIAIIATPVNPA